MENTVQQQEEDVVKQADVEVDVVDKEQLEETV